MMVTRPPNTLKNQGMVKSIIVLPAKVPTPTSNWLWASGPMPEKSTMHPSGTAPNTGKTTLPITPDHEGTRSNSSDPSLIKFEENIKM